LPGAPPRLAHRRHDRPRFVAIGDGYYAIVVRLAPNPVLDAPEQSTADQARIQLWQYAGGANQQWKVVSEGGNNFHFVARHSGRCLDVPGAAVRPRWISGQIGH
jgi:hypothetical protein